MKRYNQSQSGRSMVEILGVIAIISVLSIGGLTGLSYAMNKYRAYRIVNGAQHKTMLASTRRKAGQPANRYEAQIAEGIMGYGVSYDSSYTDASLDVSAGKKIVIDKFSKEVCNMLKDDAGLTAIRDLNRAKVLINGQLLENGPECKDGTEANTLTIVLDANTRELVNLPEREGKTCRLGGRTYDNNETVGDCGKCVDGVVKVDATKVGSCKTCKTDTWTLENKSNGSHPITEGLEKDKCCVGGVLKYDDEWCGHFCDVGGTFYFDGDDIGVCKQCKEGTVVDKEGYSLPTCKICNNEGTLEDNPECCLVGTTLYPNGTTIGTCKQCKDGSVDDIEGYEAPTCKICNDDGTLGDDPSCCKEGETLYQNGESVAPCKVCNNGTVQDVPDCVPPTCSSGFTVNECEAGKTYEVDRETLWDDTVCYQCEECPKGTPCPPLSCCVSTTITEVPEGCPAYEEAERYAEACGPYDSCCEDTPCDWEYGACACKSGDKRFMDQNEVPTCCPNKEHVTTALTAKVNGKVKQLNRIYSYENCYCQYGYAWVESKKECSCLKCADCTLAGLYDNGTVVDGYSWCDVCPAGYYCPSGSTSKIKCPAGETSYKGSTSAASCYPVWQECPNGYYQSIINCGEGCYETGCISCPSGWYCPGENYDWEKYKCPIGKYSAGGKTACSNCAAGKYTNAEGRSSCSTCPKGYYCPGGTDKQACPPGKYTASTGQKSCTTCQKGYYCPGGTDRKACPKGKYNNKTGQNACTNCPAGQYTSSTGQTSCTTCEAGYYCPGGTNRKKCPVGQYTGSTGKTACSNCPAGKYTGSTGQSSCTTCQTGYYCPGGTNRKACPVGQYTSKTGQKACSNCPAGKYTGSTGQSSCTNCEAGYYCPGGSNRKACPKGHYCPAKATKATLCPKQTIRNATKGAAKSDCKSCPSGKWANAAHTACGAKSDTYQY